MLIDFKVKFQLPIVSLSRLFFGLTEQLSHVLFEQQCAAKDAHDLHDWAAKLEIVLNDSDEAICDDCDMYLDTHGVLRLSPETLDTQVLLNPLEELMESLS